MDKTPVMLMILDGWGLGEDYPGNAIKLGNTKNYDRLIENHPNTSLDASGLAVGLPEGQMGNSEVGHLNIGAGRVIYQELPKISKEIEEGSFYRKKEFLDGIENSRKHNSDVHLIGLVSDGGVHSHINHLYGLLRLMKMQAVKNVYIHVILDGRDVAPDIGKKHVEELIEKIGEIGVGQIASISGRYYAMDRDNRWDRTQLYYDVLTMGIGEKGTDSLEVIEDSYKEGTYDEFILPTTIKKDNKPVALVKDNDTVIFFNFRPDRARQITRAIVDRDFKGFIRKKQIDTFYITMTQYDKTIENVGVVYKSNIPKNTLSEYISKQGKRQLKLAETEKYAHVTFFLNGGVESPYEGEDRILIQSPKVKTYDLQPEMSAEKVKESLIEALKEKKYDLLVVNFANPDMVGHTGKIEAVIKAIETVDRCLGEILEVVGELGVKVLVTADHGNAEKLLDENNNVVTAHTTNKVPLILVNDNARLRPGKLGDIAPTILDLMGLEKPVEMSGESLIIKK